MILVCGEALVDIVRTPGGRERPIPGGGPFNTARALARLGVPTAFLGHLSGDEYGLEISRRLMADGVAMRYATVGQEKTTVAMADVDAAGYATFEFVVDGTSAPNLTPDMLPKQLAPEVEAIHVGSLGLVLQPMADSLMTLAGKERNRRLVMVDPNVRPGLVADGEYRDRLERVIGQSTIVKASDADVAWLYPYMTLESAAERILAAGPALVVVTLGAGGTFAAHRGLRVRAPAPHVDVVDTIGAGDAFGAGLLAWLHDHGRIRPDLRLEEEELRAALEYACAVASITCTRSGAEPPRKSELRKRD